jgi:hypothetical protein
MAMQTRQTTPPSPTSRLATVTASMVTAWCGLVLWGAVAVHAGGDGTEITLPGTPLHGVPISGLAPNGTPLYGLPLPGLPPQGVTSHGAAGNAPPLPAVPQERVPSHGGRERAWGKP